MKVGSIVVKLKSLIATALQIENENDVDENIPFQELGLDSIIGVELMKNINDFYKLEIEEIVLFDYSTINQLSEYIKEQLDDAGIGDLIESKEEIKTDEEVFDFSFDDKPDSLPTTEEVIERAEPKKEALDFSFDFEEEVDSSSVTEEVIEQAQPKKEVLDFSFDFEEEADSIPVNEDVVKQPSNIQPPRKIVKTVKKIKTNNRNSLDAIQHKVTELVKGVLELDLTVQLDAEMPLQELGMDSIMGVELIKNVNSYFNLEVEEIILFDYSTVAELSGYIHSEIGDSDAVYEEEVVEEIQLETSDDVTSIHEEVVTKEVQRDIVKEVIQEKSEIEEPILSFETSDSPSTNKRTTVDNDSDDRIAIIGMSGRYAKSKNLDEYWDNIANGVDAVEEVPLDRWDTSEFYEEGGAIYAKWLGRVDNIDQFDPAIFNISATEAALMDPQHRMFMEESWKAFEDAGYRQDSLNEMKCGTYIGIMTNEYAYKLKEANVEENLALMMVGNSNSLFAARMAYLMNLKGPAIALNTACSSSLVATHLACQGLLAHETDMAIAGGVSLYLGVDAFEKMCAAGMLSKDGKCKTFDDEANGFVPGEGAGVIVLKRYKDAVRDGDNIKGVILGSGMNQDGKTNGITAPSAKAQKELIKGIYDRFNINPESISYVEAHGTGTKLGDPIEVQALKNVFKSYTDKEDFCGLGSVKSNIGHTIAAAGVAGIHKVLMQFEQKQIAPTINFESENVLLKTKNSPFYINTKLKKWDTNAGEKRRASISSFGFSGTNAHLVLEEYVPAKTSIKTNEEVIIPLAGKDKGTLKRMAENLKEFLLKKKDVSLRDLAYTFQTGRTFFGERLVLIAKNKEELVEKLNSYLSDGGIKSITGNVNNESSNFSLTGKAGEAYIKASIDEKELASLGQLWCNGMHIDWNLLYVKDRPIKISVPTYPFSKESYWFTETTVQENQNAKGKVQLHPLVHENISNLKSQRFTSEFSGNEIFIKDQKIRGDKTLPVAAFIEMANFAGNVSTEDNINRFRNITWLNPLVINGTPLKANLNLIPKGNEIEFTVYNGEDKKLNYCQGTFTRVETEEVTKVDVNTLLKNFHKSIDHETFYIGRKESGITYGNSYKGIEQLYYSESEALSKIKIDSQMPNELQQVVLLDTVLQTVIGVNYEKEGRIVIQPVHVKEITLSNKKSEFVWAHVTTATMEQSVVRFNINVYGEDGSTLLEIKELEIESNEFLDLSSDQDGLKDMVYSASWKKETKAKAEKTEAESILLLTGNRVENQELLNSFTKRLKETGNKVLIQQEPKDLPEGITAIYFMDAVLSNQIGSQATEADLNFFKALKTISVLRKNKKVKLTVFTKNTQQVHQEEDVSVYGSGIVGLLGSAAKEMYNWKTRIIDIDDSVNTTNFVEKIEGHGYSDLGELTCYRNGDFYERVFYPMNNKIQKESKLRKNGTYVILGGAGGIGKVTSIHLAKNYNAKVIWLGRRKLDDNIIKSQDEIEKIGPRPLYIQCDALDKSSVLAASNQIKNELGNVHGLFHSAIVLNDMIFNNMDMPAFEKAYLPKSIASHYFVEAFKGEPLDFVCFYSSVQSVLNAPGQANYSAGCSYKDSFSRYTENKFGIASYIINWGYWGNEGVASTKEIADRMTKVGIGSISAVEGMQVLESILSNQKRQTIILKLTDKAKKLIGSLSLDKQIYQLQQKSSTEITVSDVPSFEYDLDKESKFRELCFSGILQVLFEMGFEKQLAENNNKIANLRESLGIIDGYNLLFLETVAKLKEYGYFGGDENDIYVLDKANKAISGFDLERELSQVLKEDESYRAHCEIFGRCISDFAEVVTGKKAGLNTLFPTESMDDVSGIYKGNKQADFFNNLIADSIFEMVEQSIPKLKKGQKIRILEVGAGTGGTSEFVFKRLKPFSDHLEYLYTDVSKSFLFYAEKNYKEIAPYLQTTIFNIEKPALEQGIKMGHFDIVIGANVVHATKNIKSTVSNIKGALKTGGTLILNELANNELFGTLTFGLLDGWWLSEDPEIRLSGSPCLSDKAWGVVLQECGFTNVASYPKNQKLSLQMIVAKSNGELLVPLDFSKTLLPAKEEKKKSKSISNKKELKPGGQFTEKDNIEKIQSYLKNILAEVLRVDENEVDIQTPLQSLGIESIMINELAEKFTNDFGKIPSTIFFEYQNISELSGYFYEKHLDFFKDSNPISLGAEKMEEVNQKESWFLNEKSNRFEETIKQPREIENEIAILGIGGIYPDAKNASQLWDNVISGKLMEPEKWGKNNSFQFGAVKEDKENGILENFEINSEEFTRLNRQQKLLLQVIGQAMNESGITQDDLIKNRTGLFIGEQYDASAGENESLNDPSSYLLPNTISYLLNLKGPSESVNALCTSAYVALHKAIQSISLGECDMAIVGGVNLIDGKSVNINADLDTSSTTEITGLFTNDTYTKSFSDDASGFIGSEGAGVMIIKSLKSAKEDKNNILALVKGSGVYHGGKSFSLHAPNIQGIKEAINISLEKSKINPATIDYIEAHGIANPIADAIELKALNDAYKKKSSDPNKKWHVGSVKPTIGHPLLASGMASIIKVVKAFEHKIIPGVSGLGEINTELEKDHAFVITGEPIPWKNGTYNRRAALNSYAVGGINAHIILEEYKGDHSPKNGGDKSAKNESDLLTESTEENILKKEIEVATNENANVPFLNNKKDYDKLNFIIEEALGTPFEEIEFEKSVFEFDSIQLMQMARSINEAFDVEVKVGQIMGIETIGEFFNLLAIELDEKQKGSEKVKSLSIDIESEKHDLSEGQKGIWFDQILTPETTVYNASTAFSMKGEVTNKNLLKVSELMLEEHPILTANIYNDNEGLFLKLNQNKTVIDYGTATSEKKVLEIFKNKIKIPFNLETDSLVRFYAKYDEVTNKTYLLLIVHHIIFDGISTVLFLESFLSKYQRIINNESIEVKVPELAYFKFVDWEKKYIKSKQGQNSLAYWKDKLEGDLPVLSLPYDHKINQVERVNIVGNEILLLEGEKLQTLKNLAQHQKVNLSLLLLSFYKIFLTKITNQDDILVMTPIMGRPLKECEQSIGYYVNMMAVRNTIDTQNTFTTIVNQIKDNFIIGIDHSAYPFPKIVSELGLSEANQNADIFNVSYVFQNMFGDAFVERENYDIDQIYPELQEEFWPDYSLEIFDLKEQLKLKFNYNKQLFNSSTIQKHISYFETLMDSILDNSEDTTIVHTNLPISKLKIMDTRELKLLESFNKTVVYPKEETIISCFQKQVNKSPEDIAIVFENESLTYRELNEQSNQLAHYLKECGIEKEELIPICMERSVEMMVGILGILKVGGAYVPIDPNFPKERIQFLVQDTNAKIILTMSEFESKFESVEKQGSLVSLDILSDEINQFPKTNLKVVIADDQLVNVIYTSGSTGVPKGVLTENRSFLNRLFGMNSQFDITKKSIFLQKTTFTFDVSVWELFLPLINGAKLILVKPEGHKDPAYLLELIELHKVSIVHFIPSMLTVFLDQKIEEEKLFLTDVLSGGEVLTNDLLQQFKKQISKAKIHNNYGPAEASIDVTSIDLTNYTNEQQVIPIGKTLANNCIYIVNNAFQVNPIGVVGEIIVEGIQVSRGYLNRPNLTKEKFAESPFNKGQRIYKTGDLGKWLPNGTIAFVGRKDNQVKVRGYRIELGEIENALGQVEYVKLAAVLMREDLKGTKQLIAYIKTNQPVKTETVQAQLNKKLPVYMVPKIYVQMDDFPLLSNGKIDRNKLPKPEESAFNKREYLAPKGEIEIELTQIWQDLLGMDKIGVLDNFFELGGESILAIKLMSRINEIENVKINLADIFIQKNIKELGQLILRNQNETSEIVKLNEAVNKENLFMIHPGKAGCEVYLPFSKSLSPHYACYGVDSYNLYNKNNRITNLQKLAAHYLEQIEDIQQKTGQEKYTLFGWSFGGQIALEIAGILEKKGVKDIRVILVDTLLNDGDNKVSNWRSTPVASALVLKELNNKGNDEISLEELTNMTDFFKIENALINQNISRKLKSTNIMFFKAMMRNEEEIDKSMQTHILNLETNNIENIIEDKAQLKVLKVKDAHHHNILQREEFIMKNMLDQYPVINSF